MTGELSLDCLPAYPLIPGLPEYRNGGLLVDMGLLKLTSRGRDAAVGSQEGILQYEAFSPAVIEWRALTVIAL